MLSLLQHSILSNLIDPLVILPGLSIKLIIAFATVDLPAPDSPPIPSISGNIDAPSNQQYNKWRSSIESIIRKQSSLVNKLVSEAEDLLGKDDEKAAEKLLISSRGAPKNSRS